ncbi:MAG: hypothetical protein H0X25_07395 [Acidobacteriales bacterium]|nr:hypothetical protein [Terriglobales bacterium]
MQSNTDRGLYNFEIDWWLNCRDALCGARSSFGGQVAAIEAGGAHASNVDESGSYRHPYHEGQVEVGPRGEKAFAMDRKMRRRWILLCESDRGNATEHVRVLLAHYTASNPSEAGENGSWQKWPKGVESRLAQFAPVAIMLTPAEKIARLMDACQKGDDKGVASARARAETAIRRAHEAYQDVVRVEHEAWALGEQDRRIPNDNYLPSQMRPVSA